MKKLIILLTVIFFALPIFSQNIIGDWSGKLHVQGIQLRIVFHIIGDNNNFKVTLDSPDQAAYDLPVDSFFIKNTKIKMIMTKLAAEYSGTINAAKNKITGEFKQAGQSFPLNLKKGKIKTEKKKRYQEPEKPYPYISEDITFKNKKADITLAGTLTLPNKKGKFPAVILISGSEAQNLFYL